MDVGIGSLETERAPRMLDEPKLVANYGCTIGENPLWHPVEKRLYWTDIPNGRLFRFDPAGGMHEQCYAGRPVGGFTIQTDGALLLFMDKGTVAIRKEGSEVEVLLAAEEERHTRFNDVITDPRGRVFCGTKSTEERAGRLYRLDCDGSLHLILDNVGCPNGMAFSRDQREFYVTDSFAGEITMFDYNADDGTVCNRRCSATFHTADGLPDGATMDAQGELWSALWDGSAVVRLRADGIIAERVPVPVLRPSSITFGGDAYRDLYITTAGGEDTSTYGAMAGAMLRIPSAGQGVPEFLSSILLPPDRSLISRDRPATERKGNEPD